MVNPILDITKDTDRVTVTPNIVGQISTVVEIEVEPTKSYTVFPNAWFMVDFQSVVPADLPDDTIVELWIEDVSGDQPIRLREYALRVFNNANQFDEDQKTRLDIDKAYKLAELRKIIIKINSTVAVDFTQPTTDFLLQVKREG